MADSIPVIALSPRDLEALRAVISRTRNRSLVTDPGILPHEEAFPNPEVHIVRIPDGGLPGRVSTTVSGTGSLDFDDDTVSHALCDVYRIEQLDGDGLTDPPTYTLLLVHNVKYEVFNFLPVDIETGTLCLAFRDKFGTWVIGDVLSESSTPDPITDPAGETGTNCASLAVLDDSKCIRVEVVRAAGRCSGWTAGQIVDIQGPNDGSGVWSGLESFSADTGWWVPVYDWPEGSCCPRLALEFVGSGTGSAVGSGTGVFSSGNPVVYMRYLGCVDGRQRFASSSPTLCAQDPAGDCGDNSLVMEVTCQPCFSGGCGVIGDAWTAFVDPLYWHIRGPAGWCPDSIGAGTVLGPYTMLRAFPASGFEYFGSPGTVPCPNCTDGSGAPIDNYVSMRLTCKDLGPPVLTITAGNPTQINLATIISVSPARPLEIWAAIDATYVNPHLYPTPGTKLLIHITE